MFVEKILTEYISKKSLICQSQAIKIHTLRENYIAIIFVYERQSRWRSTDNAICADIFDSYKFQENL